MSDSTSRLNVPGRSTSADFGFTAGSEDRGDVQVNTDVKSRLNSSKKPNEIPDFDRWSSEPSFKAPLSAPMPTVTTTLAVSGMPPPAADFSLS
ncbi:MAG UNVERIFIED_CONTAM: hypothetical protein LVR18_39945 [Planctomycetaceae bacterium]